MNFGELCDLIEKRDWHPEVHRLPDEKPKFRDGKPVGFDGWEFKIVNKDDKVIYQSNVSDSKRFDAVAELAHRSLTRRRLL